MDGLNGKGRVLVSRSLPSRREVSNPVLRHRVPGAQPSFILDNNLEKPIWVMMIKFTEDMKLGRISSSLVETVLKNLLTAWHLLQMRSVLESKKASNGIPDCRNVWFQKSVRDKAVRPKCLRSVMRLPRQLRPSWAALMQAWLLEVCVFNLHTYLNHLKAFPKVRFSWSGWSQGLGIFKSSVVFTSHTIAFMRRKNILMIFADCSRSQNHSK